MNRTQRILATACLYPARQAAQAARSCPAAQGGQAQAPSTPTASRDPDRSGKSKAWRLSPSTPQSQASPAHSGLRIGLGMSSGGVAGTRSWLGSSGQRDYAKAWRTPLRAIGGVFSPTYKASGAAAACDVAVPGEGSDRAGPREGARREGARRVGATPSTETGERDKLLQASRVVQANAAEQRAGPTSAASAPDSFPDPGRDERVRQSGSNNDEGTRRGSGASPASHDANRKPRTPALPLASKGSRDRPPSPPAVARAAKPRPSYGVGPRSGAANGQRAGSRPGTATSSATAAGSSTAAGRVYGRRREDASAPASTEAMPAEPVPSRVEPGRAASNAGTGVANRRPNRISIPSIRDAFRMEDGPA